MGKYFGTDGVRGIANTELDAPLAYKMGLALASILWDGLGRRPKACIGKDTRISGDMLESALASGLAAGGADVCLLGVSPTPAVAFITLNRGFDAGAVISASHNPFEHNGIKIFGAKGYKLTDEQESRMECLMDNPPALDKTHGDVGRIERWEEGNALYAGHIIASAPCRLEGMKLVLDCSNGAASFTAQQIFTALGAECSFISCRPDGVNINLHCGSTHMESLIAKVREGGYHMGLAFDGDADRCLACDEQGRLVDGDDILGILAVHMKEQGTLKGRVVATIMSNLGLHAYLREHSIDIAATKVGDRYVLEEMLKSGDNVGGEQSGHVILSDYATTGDGEMTGVMLACALRKKGVKLSELASEIVHFPQIMVNIPVPNAVKGRIAQLDEVKELEKRVERELAGEGRINIRPSGTEALVRVMIEGRDMEKVQALAEEAAGIIEKAAACM